MTFLRISINLKGINIKIILTKMNDNIVLIYGFFLIGLTGTYQQISEFLGICGHGRSAEADHCLACSGSRYYSLHCELVQNQHREELW